MMQNMKKNPFFLSFVIFSCSLSLLCTQLATSQNSSLNYTTVYHVGVVLDMGSWVGKTSLSCISMAISNFYVINNHYKTRLVLHTRDSKGDPLRALSVAIDLLENEDVQAIIGPETSDEAEFLALLGDKAEVPIISFSATSPLISSVNTPYFIRTAPSDTSQVKAIAAIVHAFRWREIVIIYEDSTYGNGVIPSLINALEEVDARIPYGSIIPLSASNDRISEELYKLMTMQTRVFVVHMSYSLASRLFLMVKELGMMSQGYAWIVTDGLINLLYSMDSSVIDSMQGILGIRPYIPPSKELHNFSMTWRRNLSQDNPHVDIAELNVFGIWAYDTVWALAKAVESVGTVNFNTTKPDTRKNLISLEAVAISQTGSKLLKAILQSKFTGLSGEFQFIEGQMPSPAFKIVNVIGKGERGIGYWTPDRGILRKLNLSSNIRYSASMSTNLESPIWPGVSMTIPKGWVMPLSGKKLKIGVPVKKGFKELVKVERDPETNATIVTGFCIDVFKAAVEALPYVVPHEFIPFGDANGESAGTYDDLIYQVYLQNFDAVVGDVTIAANRSLYVDFTLPFTELGVAMIVSKENEKRNMWFFLKPLHVDLWLTSGAFFIFTGFVVWVIEHGINEDFQGSSAQQVGMIFWFSFSTLVFAHRAKLVSNLSRFMVIIWLFVVLVLTSSYTASLTSMLTVQQLQIDKIGYKPGPFLEGIITKLYFEDPRMTNIYTVDDYAYALSSGKVSAIVDEIPYIRLFLAKFYDTYTMINPNYITNGFAFAFQRGSPLVPDFSMAIAKLREEKKLNFIQEEWFKHQSTSTYQESPTILNLGSFCGLFLITGISSTLALIIFLAFFLYHQWHVLSKFKLRNFTLARLVFLLKSSRLWISIMHLMHGKPNEGASNLDVIVEPSPDTITSSSPNH